MKRVLSAVLMSAVLMIAYIQPTAAASPKTPTSPAPPRAAYEALKAALNADPDFARTVTVSGDTRTLTYTYRGPVVKADGESVVLAEPANSGGSGVSPQLSVGGCGWFTVCVWFNRSDQSMLETGGVAFIAAVICGIAEPMCPFASAAAGAAAYYLSSHTLCPNYLVVELFPWPGPVMGCY